MGRPSLGDAPDLRSGAEDVGGVAGERGEGRVRGQPGGDHLPHVLAEPGRGQPLRGERELDAGLVQRRGAPDLQLPQPVALLADAHRQVGLALGGGGEVEPQDHRHLLRREPVGDLPGVAPADDHRLQLELGGEIERAVDLVGRVGLERDRHLAFEGGPEGFEARVGGRALAGLAAGVVGGPLPLQPPGVEQRLPAVRDDAHERRRVLAPDHPPELGVHGDRGAEDGVARNGTAEAHERARAGEVPAVRGDEVGGEADLAPRPDRVLIELERGLHRELRGEPLAVVRFGGDERVGCGVIGGGRAALRPAEGGVEPARAARVEKAGVHGQPLPLGDERVGRDGEVRADGDDQPVADDDGGLRQHGPGLDDDPRVADGVGGGLEVGRVLGRDRNDWSRKWGCEERSEQRADEREAEVSGSHGGAESGWMK